MSPRAGATWTGDPSLFEVVVWGHPTMHAQCSGRYFLPGNETRKKVRRARDGNQGGAREGGGRGTGSAGPGDQNKETRDQSIHPFIHQSIRSRQRCPSINIISINIVAVEVGHSTSSGRHRSFHPSPLLSLSGSTAPTPGKRSLFPSSLSSSSRPDTTTSSLRVRQRNPFSVSNPDLSGQEVLT